VSGHSFTLGYGDILPTSGCKCLLAVLEAGLDLISGCSDRVPADNLLQVFEARSSNFAAGRAGSLRTAVAEFVPARFKSQDSKTVPYPTFASE